MLFNMLAVTSTKFQSYEEGSVSFSCPYDSEHQNSLKYICRGNRTSTCLQRALVTSDSQQNGQFRLKDDKGSRKVTVTITDLTQEDAGWYLCGVQHTGLDVFSAVELVVKGERSKFYLIISCSAPLLCTADKSSTN